MFCDAITFKGKKEEVHGLWHLKISLLVKMHVMRVEVSEETRKRCSCTKQKRSHVLKVRRSIVQM